MCSEDLNGNLFFMQRFLGWFNPQSNQSLFPPPLSNSGMLHKSPPFNTYSFWCVTLLQQNSLVIKYLFYNSCRVLYTFLFWTWPQKLIRRLTVFQSFLIISQDAKVIRPWDSVIGDHATPDMNRTFILYFKRGVYVQYSYFSKNISPRN